jgi:hypothetical protein
MQDVVVSWNLYMLNFHFSFGKLRNSLEVCETKKEQDEI